MTTSLLLSALACGVPLPQGTTGPDADALARQMVDAVNHEAWAQTGAVRWTFSGKHEHLWDRERHLSRVRWKDREVLVDLTQRVGRAWEDGVEVTGDDAQELVDAAWGYWVNDAFWLNPVVKAFDDGVTRYRVTTEGEGTALLVSYASGGATPGDSYLWILDEAHRPIAWRMWVSILPIDGVHTTWEGWVQLDTGAWVATAHSLGPLTLEITDVAGASMLAELEPGPDPFAALME